MPPATALTLHAAEAPGRQRASSSLRNPKSPGPCPLLESEPNFFATIQFFLGLALNLSISRALSKTTISQNA